MILRLSVSWNRVTTTHHSYGTACYSCIILQLIFSIFLSYSLFDLITIPGITRLQDIKFSIIFLIHLPLHCILANISLSLKKCHWYFCPFYGKILLEFPWLLELIITFNCSADLVRLLWALFSLWMLSLHAIVRSKFTSW